MRYAPVVLLFVAAQAHAQVKPKNPNQYHPGVDQGRVDKAITKGVEFLKSAPSPGAHREIANCDELILLTLITAGLPDNDAKYKELLEKALTSKLERTYKVCLLAMSLEEIDRVKYQNRIWQCGQFLCDNQAPNGQWSYGEPSVFVEDVPTSAPRKDISTGGGVAARPKYDPSLPFDAKIKPKVTRKLPVKKQRPGVAGDDSNSQYAALGLRACHDSGIVFPKDVVELARKWWEGSQHAVEKGQGKPAAAGLPPAGPSVPTGGKVQILGEPRGWCYQDTYGVCKGGPAYSSMTFGAVGAVCIYDFMLGRDWTRDKVVQDGMAWMAVNFSVTENVGPSETHGGRPNAWLYYTLYALERVGMLYDTAFVGTHDWYLEGAKVILDAQKADGSWNESGDNATWDTCFAILFLKRATRRLDVATGGNK
jgi:hypothetical protein